MAHILAVDGEPLIVDTIRRVLQPEGHDVTIALDGLRALDLARQNPPDLILLDIIMPGMDGIQVCQALKADPVLFAIPVLFLAGVGMIEDKLAAFDAGGDDCLTKPFDVRELVARVRALLRRTLGLQPPPGALAARAPLSSPLSAPPIARAGENQLKHGLDLPVLRIYGLGQARVLRDGHLVTSAEWQSATTKELFFYFLLHRTGLRKEEVLDVFWCNTPVERANSVFHSTLYRLRHALGRDVVVHEGGWYSLNPDLRLWFDADTFRGLLTQAHAAAPEDPARLIDLQTAVDLYRGDFLEEFYSDWPFFERETLREHYIVALVELADDYTRQANYPRALELYKSALARDHYRDDILHKIVACYTLAGQQSAGMRYYEEWRRLYETELGSAPGI